MQPYSQQGGAAVDEKSANISSLIPRKLDDIVKQNRDKVSLRLASDSEIRAMKAEIIFDNIPRATLDDWRLVAVEFHSHHTDLILIGKRRDNEYPWVTSVVREVDLERNVLRTENSFYGLGVRGTGEPASYLLMCICAALHKWGIGKSLGVTPFFY